MFWFARRANTRSTHKQLNPEKLKKTTTTTKKQAKIIKSRGTLTVHNTVTSLWIFIVSTHFVDGGGGGDGEFWESEGWGLTPETPVAGNSDPLTVSPSVKAMWRSKRQWTASRERRNSSKCNTIRTVTLYIHCNEEPDSIVQEVCESRGGRPGLSVLTSLLVSVDVKNYWTVLRHWSQLVPNMSADIWGH